MTYLLCKINFVERMPLMTVADSWNEQFRIILIPVEWLAWTRINFYNPNLIESHLLLFQVKFQLNFWVRLIQKLSISTFYWTCDCLGHSSVTNIQYIRAYGLGKSWCRNCLVYRKYLDWELSYVTFPLSNKNNFPSGFLLERKSKRNPLINKITQNFKF